MNSSALNILYTITAYPPAIGGAQLHTHKIASALAQTHSVNVIAQWTENRTDWLLGTTIKSPEITANYELDGVPVQQITLSQSERRSLLPYVLGYYGIKTIAINRISDKLLSKLGTYAPPHLDLIQNIRIGREGLSYASLKLARKLNIPFIFVPLHHPRWVGWNYRDYINLYKEADGIIALTNTEKQVLIDLGVKPEKIFITGIGPLIAETSQPEKFRRQYSLKNDPIILFLGQKYKYKGIQALCLAAQLLWRKLPDVRFVFIGPRTDYSKKLFITIKDPRVLELGRVSLKEKTNALAACDILCVPSMQESFGGVYTEGWTMKKPVIGGNIPAIRDVIDDGLNGFVVEQDPGQLAERIIQLIENKSLREKMGAAGYNKVVEQYTWEKLAEKMEAAYHQVLQG
jgi:glycosyltransferase involved in cell wall biosynthesis